jgi:hypothetical protein
MRELPESDGRVERQVLTPGAFTQGWVSDPDAEAQQ